jgi:hypothetical protein
MIEMIIKISQIVMKMGIFLEHKTGNENIQNEDSGQGEGFENCYFIM